LRPVPDRLLREKIVFKPHKGRRRKLDERVWARFAWLIPITTRAILRLPLRSRLRRTMVRYWVQRSYEIVNRRDFDLALAGQHPEVRIRWSGDPATGIAPDLVGREFQGHEGFRHAWNAWLEAFDDLQVEPNEVTDLGDRLLIGIRSVGRGTASGAQVDQNGFTLYTFREGLVASQEFFLDRETAERAAGLS
jgi:ketosteroid isomerase-like protein